jgi:hypothetical protein
MRISAVVFLCILGLFAKPVNGQEGILKPLRVSPGTVLSFYLQARLHPSAENDVDVLPSGTVIQVKILDAIDSNVDRDGFEFRGVVVSSVVAGNVTVVHADAEVRGILALLRSRNHPDGFRYELLMTGMNDHGKTYDLTASLNPSFRDSGDQPAPVANAEVKSDHKDAATAGGKLPVPASN